MDHSAVALQSVLILLASSVLAVAACRSLRVPPIIGYLVDRRRARPACARRGVGGRGDQPPRRVRRGVPHVLHRPRVQPDQAEDDAPPRVRARRRAGRRHHRARGRRRGAARRAVAGRPRAGRHPRHVLDRDRVEAAGGARRARQRARPRGDRGAAVPGPRGGAAAGADPGAGPAGGRHRPRHGGGARQGGRGADAGDRRRAAADARLAARGGAAPLERAVRAQRAADHAGGRLHHRGGRAVAGPRRVPRRHADLGDRVPLPGRAGHQAVPRRAARAVLRHRGHDARPAPGRGAVLAGARFPRGPDARQVRADRRAVARVRRQHRHRAARRPRARAGRRVRLRAAGARRHRRHRARASCCSRCSPP